MKLMKKIYSLFIFSLCVLVSSFSQQLLRETDRKEILVQVQPGTDVEELLVKTEAQSEEPAGLQIKKYVAPDWGFYLFSFENTAGKDALLKTIRQQPQVISAQWNQPVQFRETTPNDPLFPNQWDMERIQLSKVWDMATGGTTPLGDEIVIAVLDRGFDLTHEDFQGNIWVNTAEIPGDGIDNDGNGFKDDVNGWNFRNNSPDFFVENHGTWVTGILGAKGNNGTGLAGVNWNVKLMFLGIQYPDEVVAAFNYVLKQRELYNTTNGEKGAFIVVTNGSFGLDTISCEEQPAWGAVYDPLGQAGVLSVAATANRNWDIDKLGDIPTSCPSEFLLSVTATNSSDEKVENAAFGKTTIDLGAPGNGTTTTNTLSRYYEAFNGTSSACPHVAGVISLLYSLPCTDIAGLSLSKPADAARLVRDAILKGVDPLPTLKDKTVTGGRLNAFNSAKYLHSYCIAKPDERAVGNFFEVNFSRQGLVRVYPNPVSDKLYIDYSNEDFTDFSVKIFNALGQEVRFPASHLTTPFEAQRLEIDVTDWTSGTYFITLSDTGKKITRRFVKISN
jgi:subtilisin family serine protease